MQMESKIEDLIYYRDNLQIEDKENIQKVLNELIPEYKAEQENKELRKLGFLLSFTFCFGLTINCSPKALPCLKVTISLASILSFSPVLGLRPILFWTLFY